MSIVSCFFTILLFCISTKQDSCEARHIGSRHKGSTIFAADFHYSGEEVPRPAGEKVQLKGGRTIGGDSVDHNDDKGDVRTDQELAKRGFSLKGKFSGAVLRNKQLHVYVSWRAASKKRDNKKSHNEDEHPELYSDYSRPRTRPPSHN